LKADSLVWDHHDLEAVMGRIVLATLAGAVVMFVVGFLIYGVAMVSFFAANVGAATNALKDPPEVIYIALATLITALLYTMVISRWENATSLAGGAKVGALLGFMIALAMDLTLYGTTNVQNMTATLVDPICSLPVGLAGGAVIGMVLGRRTA
jgi:hypothetical protein